MKPKIYPDKRRKRWPLGVLALAGILALAGGLAYKQQIVSPSSAPTLGGMPQPSLLAAGQDTPSEPVAAVTPTPTRSPVMDKLSPLSRYDKLVSSGNPVDAKLAHDLTQRCIDDMWAIPHMPEDLREAQRETARQECGDLTTRPAILEPIVQMELLKRAAEAGVHQAYFDLWRNHVQGTRTMPPGPETDAYMERMRQIALSTADPWALAEEVGRSEGTGDKPLQLALYVAHRTALARERNDPYDPKTDRPTLAKAAELPPDVAAARIEQGQQFTQQRFKNRGR